MVNLILNSVYFANHAKESCSSQRDKCSWKNQVATPGIRIFDVCSEPKERSGNCPENGTGQNDINSETVTSKSNTGKHTK